MIGFLPHVPLGMNAFDDDNDDDDDDVVRDDNTYTCRQIH